MKMLNSFFCLLAIAVTLTVGSFAQAYECCGGVELYCRLHEGGSWRIDSCNVDGSYNYTCYNSWIGNWSGVCSPSQPCD